MGEAVLETRSLSKKYNASFALKDCSITVECGQIYGLVGKNGAGKTTLMRLICGQSNPTSGTPRCSAKAMAAPWWKAEHGLAA